MIETPTFGRAACAAPHRLAAEAGRAILGEGGNALEAMVAMAATVAVVYPHMNGVGGDGFWLIREPKGRVRAIEACGFAGSRATREAYVHAGHDAIPSRGPLSAVTLPGAVGGWDLALAYARDGGGRLPLGVILEDAVRHARDGYPQSRSEAQAAPHAFDALKQAPGFAAAFLEKGAFPAAGTPRKAMRLAATLDQLGRAGLDDFYRGDVAREMAADMEGLGVPVTRGDLKAYRAVWRTPLELALPDVTAFNTQPPTQGLASLMILGVFERLGVTRAEEFAHVHGLVEATKRAFAIRDRVCTDFDRLTEEPESFLTPKALQREADMIDRRRAATQPVAPAKGDTIWMGAVDAQGLAVSYIQSIYWEYGSGCVLPATGVLLQNRGSSFSLDPRAVNPLEPGRRPFHTLNPAMAIFRDGRVMPYGSMGGDGQPQFQAQVLSRVRFGVGLAEAIDRPRFLFGRTWGAASPALKMEARFDETLVAQLRRAGHDVDVSPHGWHEGFGHAGGLIRHARGRVEAAHDPRSDGGAAGM